MIVGPTASGKTDLALAVARRFDGEIVSLDSRQMYRGMDIGAAVPAGVWRTVRGRRTYFVDGIAHHLLAFRSPAKPLSAVEVKALAVRAARVVIRRGHLPVFCGGTGLYADMIARNFSVPAVKPDLKLRARLMKRSTEDLFADLKAKDPAYAARISPQNRRYLVRALEVIATTGRPFSEQQKEGRPLFQFLKLGVSRPRPVLYGRINRRVDAMLEAGLLAEAKKLGKKYGWDGVPLTSLGHRQLGEHLRGEISLPEAVDRIKIQTRHYAKRQLTWFKRDGDIFWVKTPKDALAKTKTFLAE